MNWKAVFVVLVLGALAWSRPADAEKVKTNQTAKLYTRAGEQSPVILTLKSGQTMTVLAKDGRWIKVRVSGRTGWIPRSKVDLPNDDEEIARNTRRRPFVDGRGTKRGFGGESGPDDRIGADATGDGDDAPQPSGKVARSDDGDRPARKKPRGGDDDDARPARKSRGDDDAGSGKKSRGDDDAGSGKKSRRDDDAGSGKDDGDDAKEATRPTAHVAKSTDIYNEPNAGSDASFTAGPKTALYVVEEKGKWTFVENDEGDAGYVLTSKLDIDAPAAGSHTRMIDLRGRLGLAQVNQSVSTPGGTSPIPDNYSAGSSSIGIALGAEVLYPYQKRYWLGGEFGYAYTTTLFGGIQSMNKTTGFSFHNFNLRALGGYDLEDKRGMIAFGRLGYHYDSFQVDNVNDFTQNTARIPSQIIKGPTIGGGLAIPRLTDSLGLQAGLDLLLIGASLTQTKNLEDGTGPGAKAIYLGTALNYRWKPKIDIQGTLDLGYTSISFDGAAPTTSMRMHTGTGASSGSDFNVTLAVGVSYAL
ncbi:MAG TPA: SH3 domain-containing protein [Kofleriaceae bacterium]|jgi:SH3-like domain-containing protein|nr:SH3 domain-containing protein [Kofleriaceae bacterium]